MRKKVLHVSLISVSTCSPRRLNKGVFWLEYMGFFYFIFKNGTLGSCLKHMGNQLGYCVKHTFFIPNCLAQKAAEESWDWVQDPSSKWSTPPPFSLMRTALLSSCVEWSRNREDPLHRSPRRSNKRILTGCWTQSVLRDAACYPFWGCHILLNILNTSLWAALQLFNLSLY